MKKINNNKIKPLNLILWKAFQQAALLFFTPWDGPYAQSYAAHR